MRSLTFIVEHHPLPKAGVTNPLAKLKLRLCPTGLIATTQTHRPGDAITQPHLPQQIRGDFSDKAGNPMVLVLPIQTARLRIGHDQLFPGAGDPDITESSLLFEAPRFFQSHSMRSEERRV